LCCGTEPTREVAASSTLTSSRPLDQRPQPWQRRDKPIVSIDTMKQEWSKNILYSPTVIVVNGVFKMWYVGSAGDYYHGPGVMNLGYAESTDGIHWKEYAGNPILTGKDLPFAPDFQTPFVLFDQDERIYKMWFVGLHLDIKNKKMDQLLGYATSPDGVHWKIHPEPIYWSGRSPSIIKEGPNRYRMWMNSRPSPDTNDMDLYGYIYEFKSSDGIRWERGAESVIRPSEKAVRGVIYPYVLKEDDGYRMWYGSFNDPAVDDRFHIYSAASKDGSHWKIRHDEAAFAALPGSGRFDSKFVSTPRVVSMKDRYLLYYSARDDRAVDGGNFYQHVGLAVIPKK
jgi:predicted GH43/DUF377 family glycosyl hydrolase